LALLKEHVAEALVGLLVLLFAAWFAFYALERSSGIGVDRYTVTARFPNAAGIDVGSDVRVSGMKVGTVTSQTLDPVTWQAVLTFAVDSKLKLPADSSAAISSDGLLGGAHIALIPGGDPEPLMPGDEIIDTQGATDLMGLIGSFINRSGGDSGSRGE